MKKLAFACIFLIFALFGAKYGDEIILDIMPPHADPLSLLPSGVLLAEYNCNIKIYITTPRGKTPFETILNAGVKGFVLNIDEQHADDEEIPPHLATAQLRQSLIDTVHKLYIPLIAPRGKGCPQPDIVSEPKRKADEKTHNPDYVTINITVRAKRMNDKPVMLIEKRYFRPVPDGKEEMQLTQLYPSSVIIPFDMPHDEAKEKITAFFGAHMVLSAWNPITAVITHY